MALDSRMVSRLRGQAQKLDPVIWIGRRGVTDAAADQVSQALDDHELVKAVVQDGAPDDAKGIATQLSERLGAEIVQVIGRRFVLFRLSEKVEKDRMRKEKERKAAGPAGRRPAR